MRRLPILLSATLIGPGAMLAVPVPAEAAIPDVVRAVQQQLVKGASMKFTQYGTVTLNGRNRSANHMARVFRFNPIQDGTLQLGRNGIAAVGLTRRVAFDRENLPLAKEHAAEGDLVAKSLVTQTRPHRWVNTNGWFYDTARLWTAGLPGGKTWARRAKGTPAVTAFRDQVINIFEIRTLKTLIANADERKFGLPNPAGKTPAMRKTGWYAGSITFGELYKLSPTFRAVAGKRPDASFTHRVVIWRIIFDANGLPFQFGSGWSVKDRQKNADGGGATIKVVSWGPATTIARPKPAQVGVVRAPAGGLPAFDNMVEMIKAAL
ncbi:hypothetical protein SAMN05421869_13445 [Nonomuraea jiangxiensis]|uniref:Uncharacterized protein n=2 Tax=Nonomuraea jiangxiensis TaxID=633440 RepID=A0A1G9PNS8_9ACTN|nr:hypothetical protein SAMN05421869_13445 [Nonomuraea jiangxiensis]